MIFSLLIQVAWAALPFHSYKINKLEVHRDFSKPNLIWSQEARESDSSGEISLIVLYRAMTDALAERMLQDPEHTSRLALHEVPKAKALQEAYAQILQRIQKMGSSPAIRAAAAKSLPAAFKTYEELEVKLEPVLAELYKHMDPLHQPLNQTELALSLARAKDYHLPPQSTARMSVSVELAPSAVRVLP